MEIERKDNLNAKQPLSVQEYVKQQADTDRQQSFVSDLAYLSVIKISGQDAEQFLQGQLTCHVPEMDQQHAVFAAFCNAKGRTISSLMLLRHGNEFFMLLPADLRAKVVSKLRLYVLRSDVQFAEMQDLKVRGVMLDHPQLSLNNDAFAVSQAEDIWVRLAAAPNYYYVISESERDMHSIGQDLEKNNFFSVCTAVWQYQEFILGIPWLRQQTSEQFIPQMLNIDGLGGISFNKGCYTGQEIIARTHYLGKTKRRLFLGVSQYIENVEICCPVMADSTDLQLGQVIEALRWDEQHYYLIVMAENEVTENNLTLANEFKNKITIIDFQ